MPDKYDRYPHKLAVTEKCMGHETAHKVATGQLESATSTFLHRVEQFRAGALAVEQKEKIFPHLKNLVRCGWPVEYARAIIESHGGDAKSLSWADAALGSIGAFSRDRGMEHRHTMHVAMYYIGEVLEEAVKAGFRPDQPRHPAGSSTGGRWSGGAGTGGTTTSGRGRTEGHGPHRVDIPDDRPLEDVVARNTPGNPFDDMLNEILEGGGGQGFGGGPVTSKPGTPPQKTVQKAPREEEYLKDLRDLPEGVVEISKGGKSLSPSAKRKFKKWLKKNKSIHPESIEITTYSDGRSIYTFTAPGDSPGSYRVYDKHVDADGTMMITRAVTIDKNGMRIHAKDKVTKRVVEYDTTTGKIKKIYYED